MVRRRFYADEIVKEYFQYHKGTYKIYNPYHEPDNSLAFPYEWRSANFLLLTNLW